MIFRQSINKRVVGKLYPKRIMLFDLLNLNVDFNKWAEKHKMAKFFEDNKLRKWNYPERTVDMYEFINHEIFYNQKIDYLEFGVWKGRTLNIWTKLNMHPESRFFGFDSFEGLPEDWSFAFGGMKKGAFTLDGKPPELGDGRIHLIKGLFQITLSNFIKNYEPKNNLVVHMDADLYSSTLFCLATLDCVLNDAVVIFDEFDNLPHEFSAFMDYTNSFRRDYEVIARFDYYKKVAIRFGSRIN